MGDAGMLRLALEDVFQDRRRLELIGVGLIGGRSRNVEREGVVDLRLVVLRIVLRHRRHGLEIGLHAAAMIELVIVGIERAERVDKLPFARRLCADGFGLLNGREPFRQIGGGRDAERIEQQAHADAPVGDGAVRIGLEHVLEDILRRAVPERMLIAHAAIEPALRHLIARRLEMDGTEPLFGGVLCRGRLREPADEDGGKNGG